MKALRVIGVTAFCVKIVAVFGIAVIFLGWGIDDGLANEWPPRIDRLFDVLLWTAIVSIFVYWPCLKIAGWDDPPPTDGTGW